MRALEPVRRTDPAVFKIRRGRLSTRSPGPAVIVAGLPRSRNFPHNLYPFRASSHFLYLVGVPLEGAALFLEPGNATLYCPQPDPGGLIWHGPTPSLGELAEQLDLEVRPLSELAKLPSETATIPPPDPESAQWLSELLGRTLQAGRSNALTVEDAALADALVAERLIHDQAALDQIRLAIEVTTAAHLAAMRATQGARRESEVKAAAESVFIAADMAPAYGSIVTVHGQVLHNSSHHRLIRAGDLLLCDAGAETVEGWASDITRTWPVSGSFSGPQRAIYELVRHVQREAIERVTPGVEFRDLHDGAGRSLVAGLVDVGIFDGDPGQLWADGAADVFFPHGLGHLLGLDVHDMEDLGDRAGYAPRRTRTASGNARFLRLDRQLAPNMVVTIEPGFYQIAPLIEQARTGVLGKALNASKLAAFADVRGIRIEDDVRVTRSGHEVLSQGLVSGAEEIEQAVRSH